MAWQLSQPTKTWEMRRWRFYLRWRSTAYKCIVKLALTFACSGSEMVGVSADRFHISMNIYFDGFLPPGKAVVRVSRLENQIWRLSAYQSLHPQGFHEDGQPPKPHTADIAWVLDSASTEPAIQDPPAAPFLVAAVLETIKTSAYARITEVVPGEADAYCAAAARRSGGAILSNDSDLLIYDLGLEGTIGSLADLTFTICDKRKCPATRTNVIQPQKLAQTLKLESLKDIAFVLIKNPGISFKKALPQARRPKMEGIQFEETLSEYMIEPAVYEAEMFRPETLHRVRTQAPFLDPRISEFVLQANNQSVSMYLPIMLEDPERTSAFAASFPQRVFAYSCCTSFNYKVTDREMYEYCRKGRKVVQTPITLLSKDELHNHAQKLRARLQLFRTTFSAFPVSVMYRSYAIAEVYHWYLDTDRTPPSRDILAAALTGKVDGQTTWDIIHLFAQIEAGLYSLRMIQQILGFVLPSDPVDKIETSVLQSLLSLNKVMKSLPPLRQLLPSRWELCAQTANMEVDKILDLLAHILQADVHRKQTELNQD